MLTNLALPAISISDASVVEGDSGTKAMVFRVRSVAASNAAVTVRFSSADGSAKEGADYVAARGTVTSYPRFGWWRQRDDHRVR